VKSNVPVAQAINDEAVLPERVQEALGQLVGAAKTVGPASHALGVAIVSGAEPRWRHVHHTGRRHRHVGRVIAAER
jgi:hypothetical protein